MKKLLLFLVCCLMAAAPAHAAPANKVAAVVNGRMITMFDLEQALKPELLRRKVSMGSPAATELQKKVLQEMVTDLLLEHEAARLKVAISDQEVDGEIARIMEQSGLKRDDFAKKLASEGLNPTSLRSRIKSSLLRQKIMGAQVARKVVVSQEEIKAYYEAHKASFSTQPTVHVALLVYPPSKEALKYAEPIRLGKIPFAEAASKMTIGPNREKGGDLGSVPEDKLTPVLRSKLQGLSNGQVSAVFNLDGHKAQVQLIERQGERRPLSFEEAKPQIDDLLREPKARERFEEYMSQLRSKAIIDIRL
ncbi:MAG: SurA N-terminal domain-containing protein [Desulfovibrionaceae bacterium]|nr:SurA N-terminal domain-containing protein [Desulfovibrionaceae bacterium]